MLATLPPPIPITELTELFGILDSIELLTLWYLEHRKDRDHLNTVNYEIQIKKNRVAVLLPCSSWWNWITLRLIFKSTTLQNSINIILDYGMNNLNNHLSQEKYKKANCFIFIYSNCQNQIILRFIFMCTTLQNRIYFNLVYNEI